MCILFVYRSNPSSNSKYKLILASNRDEYFNRPAKPADFWSEKPALLGGRDMEPGREGGTWLAMNTISGRIGVLLNITTPSVIPDKKGRGSIVTDFIKDNESALDYCNSLKNASDQYNGFNFVGIEASPPCPKITHLCSADGNIMQFDHDDEYFGFGNAPYHTPYKKVAETLKRFRDTIQKEHNNDGTALESGLLQVLRSNQRHWPDSQIKLQTEGWSEDVQENLSSAFVSLPESGYGTRTNTIITVDQSNQCKFTEWTMKDSTQNTCTSEWVQSNYQYKIN